MYAESPKETAPSPGTHWAIALAPNPAHMVPDIKVAAIWYQFKVSPRPCSRQIRVTAPVNPTTQIAQTGKWLSSGGSMLPTCL